jgi:hypothetical protein
VPYRLTVSVCARYDGWCGQRGALAPSLLPQRHVDPSLRSLGLGVVRHVAGLIDGSRSEVSTRIWRKRCIPNC